MKRWVISDTHFNHANIIRYCDRPFNSVEQMNEELIKRWNNTVAKDDIVYHLGDFAFGNKEQLASILMRLNGRIRLIMGNHDHKKWKDYLECGCDRVYEGPIILDNWAILSHHPHFVNLQMPYINIYGHVHDDSNHTTIGACGACVCVERWDYKPVDLDKLLADICKIRDKMGTMV